MPVGTVRQSSRDAHPRGCQVSSRRTLSPRDLARAIGSSESSLKRWADEGKIRVHRTAGGHRRITLDEAVRYIRASGAPLVDASALGLGDFGRMLDAELAVAADLYELLLHGEEASARGAIVWAYLRGDALSEYFDTTVSDAMRRLGTLWQTDEAGIFYEHRATEICLHALHQVRALLPEAPEQPVAVGSGIAHDPYVLPSLMASMVLQTEGWNAVNLGADCPAAAVLQAATHHRARLVWVSVTSSELDAEAVSAEIAALEAGCRELGASLALGGQRRDLLSGVETGSAFVGHSMRELVAFVRGLRAGGEH